uniref:GAG-pre-integrase domain-containing protein n=1 Tax=Solanum lycopersicum TaxID=4081 RepID=A0A3Q7IDW7_SOLLC
MYEHGLTKDLSGISLSKKVCESCQMGKVHRKSYPNSATYRATEKLELLYTNSCIIQLYITYALIFDLTDPFETYCLKQAPRQFNAKLSEALLKFDFKKRQDDHSLFVNKTTRRMMLKKIKDLGELRNYLGIEFARSKQGILMYQRKSELESIVETGLSAAKPAGTPLNTNSKLTTK